MFGAISLCAFLFDALAVRLWFKGARKTGAFIGAIACLAFVVTFSNSLGRHCQPRRHREARDSK